MDTKTEYLDTHEVRITVEPASKDIEKAMKTAAKRLSRRYRIPGFRKGKAPYWRVLQAFGEDALFEEALEELADAAYVGAMQENDIESYSDGTLVNVDKDPLVFTYKVPLLPEVDLGDYRALRVPFKPPEAGDDGEQIDEAIEDLRKRYSQIEPVDRAADWGDLVTLDLFVVLLEEGQEEIDEDEEIPDDRILLDEELKIVLDAEEDLLPGFSAELVGISEGEDVVFTLSIPEDFENTSLQGRRVLCEITCQNVAEPVLPVLDDDFAQKASDGECETVSDLRRIMGERIRENFENEVQTAYAEKVIDTLLESATLAYPPIMVNEKILEKINVFAERLMHQGLTLEDYLNIQGETQEDLVKEFSEPAERDLRRGLVLGQVLVEEEISTSGEELQAEISRRLGLIKLTPDQLNERFLQLMASDVLTSICIDRMVAIAKGEDPPKGFPKPEEQEEESSTDDAPEDTPDDDVPEDASDDDAAS